MHDRDATYQLVRSAILVGEQAAADIAMLGGTFETTVFKVRERIEACPVPWSGPLLGPISHLQDDDTVGRFKMLQSPWNVHMKAQGQQWAQGLRSVALSSSPEVALARAQPLQDLSGAGPFQLGQILHLLHPTWFAIVNEASTQFWSSQGYKVGRLANLERISADYRDMIRDYELDFNVIDDLFGPSE